MSGKEASLYFHIPFCKKKCDYCHFYVIPDKQPFKEALLQGFSLEWDSWKVHLQNQTLCSIYFGGGTPFLLGPEAIRTILSWIEPRNIEITLEANPEDVTQEAMRAFKESGINRISLGVQSFDDALLQRLSRTHKADKAIDAVHSTFRAGIENISIDLMYDLPGQTLKSWQHTLEQAVQLPITHLSLYNLTIEPQTVFFKYKEKITSAMPEAEVSAIMYRTAQDVLNRAGFEQYEISAFARNRKHSIHNTGYWTGRPFLGIGPSAFSYWNQKRFRNVAHLHKWHRALQEKNSPIDFEEELSSNSRNNELLAIRLRLMEGADLEDYTLEPETLRALKELVEKGLLIQERSRVKLSSQGILFYDTVASELV